MSILEMIGTGLALLKDFVEAYKVQVQINQFNAKLQWAQTLQAGLQPLEGGQPVVTDAQRLAAVKAVADAWANMPSL